MKTIKKFFCQFDFYSAPASLRIRQEPQMKTCVVGLISLALMIFFVYVFVQSSIAVLNFEKISYSSSQTTIASTLARAQFPMFGVTLDWMDEDQFSDMFQIWTYSYKNGVSTRIPMRPCEAKDWILLGDNYTQQFNANYLQYFFCPDITENITLRDTFKNTPDYLSVSLYPCDNAVVATCNTSKILQYLHTETASYSVIQLTVYILDIGIHPDAYKAVEYFINIDTKIQMTSTFGGGASVQFSTYRINTDVNVLPWEDIQTQTGSMIDTVRNYQIGFTDITTDRIGVIYFTMNQKSFLIDRKIGKVDEVLSYAGGLFSLIIAFFGLFLQSFNQYKYELTVAEGAFTNDKQNKVATSDDLHVWTYLKYTIFDWVNVAFCRQIPWKDCKDINQTRDEVINHLEADRLLRRLNKIQNGLKLCLSNEEDVCVNLIGPPKLDYAKNNRLILDYYGEIINGRCPLTLEEINSQDKFSAYLNLPGDTNMSSKINPDMDSTFVIGNPKIVQNYKDGSKNFFQQSGLVWEDQDRLNMIGNILQTYPEIKKQAQQIVLDEEYEKTEIEIAQSFMGLKPEVRAKLQERIPILILYRLLKRIKQIKGPVNGA